MAEGIGRDIIVDAEEWDAIIGQLEAKDKAVKDMLDKFIEALNILVNDGFIRSTRHDNMEIFTKEITNLRSQIDGVYESAKSAANDFKKNTESADQYMSIFHLGG